MEVIVECEQTLPSVRKEVVLLLEHKIPGTLRRNDWVSGLYNGAGELKCNGIIIIGQSRKYVCAASLNIIGVFDSTALVGMCLRNQDRAFWNTNRQLPLKLFYEDRPRKFLLCLLAMIVMGLRDRNFI